MSSSIPDPSSGVLKAAEKCIGKWVRISFNDGETSEARIIEVDAEEHYDVVYERSSEPDSPYHRAMLDEIESITVLEDEGFPGGS